MSEVGDGQKPAISKRKAWVFESKARPGFSDFFAGGERRAAFRKYWIKDTLTDIIDLSVHFGLKLTSMDTCSNMGAKIGQFAIPRYFKTQGARARATIAHVRPDLDDAGRKALYEEYVTSQGRLMTEFSVIPRLMTAEDRLTLHDFDRHVYATAKEGGVILVGMHLGNWEIGSIVYRMGGIRAYANYVPPVDRAKAWIAHRVRSKAGLNFLPPGAAGVRPSLKVLKSGGAISMFCDEGYQGRIRGPLFGRPPHAEGNLAVAVRLSRMTGAPICPWYSLRREGFRFEAWSLPPLHLPPEEKPGSRLMEDVALLNDIIEPVIRENIAQWYFVDNMLPD